MFKTTKNKLNNKINKSLYQIILSAYKLISKVRKYNFIIYLLLLIIILAP